jgi:hypothetical protein
MKYEGVSPNVWILPSKMSIYVTMVPSAEVEFYRKGSGAAANLEKGPDNLLTFRGSKVFETRPFDIDFIGEPRDLLVRQRQIGEYFVFPTQAEAGTGNPRDIYIYSMDSDRFEKMDYAILAEQAKLNAEASGVATGSDGTVLLLRPFQTYNMASAVLMKGGLDTGFTAHGHHDFMLTDDVIHKVHIGHYTFYHKSIVKQSKNIILAEDIFAHSYISGEGTGIFPGEGKKGSFSEQLSRDTFTHDIIPVWIPQVKDDNGRDVIPHPQNPLDITGHYNNQTLDANNSTLDDDKEHYEGANKYAARLGFNRLQNYDQNDQFLSPMRHLNTVCFQGHQLSWDSEKKSFAKVTTNTGHWGPNVYPGCRAVRNGENAFLKDMEYEKLAVGGARN